MFLEINNFIQERLICHNIMKNSERLYSWVSKPRPFNLSCTSRIPLGFSLRNHVSRGARVCCREVWLSSTRIKSPRVKNLCLNDKNLAVWQKIISSPLLMGFQRTASFPFDFHVCRLDSHASSGQMLIDSNPKNDKSEHYACWTSIILKTAYHRSHFWTMPLYLSK